MSKAKKGEGCCTAPGDVKARCRMESLISVDERGQMVLPKELRDRAKIGTGDKLALISWEKDGEICCFTLVRADFLADKVKDFLEPIMMTR
ncbi:MAG: hypothetical protein A4E67_00435 [Syntrophaceae bacterium PtaB.Bin038]|jgi:antitoxin PrlF|nr:MAG: hypothetical protein A4E67_00435 [Syntrophaceae bacterium PtaB.Bin038]